MKKVIHFAKQDKNPKNKAFTQESLKEMIAERKKNGAKYDNLEDRSLVGDKLFFVMLKEEIKTSDEGKSRFDMTVARIRKSKVEEELKGYEFEGMVSGDIPRFRKVK